MNSVMADKLPRDTALRHGVTLSRHALAWKQLGVMFAVVFLLASFPASAQLGKPSAEDLSKQQRRFPFSIPASTPNSDPHDLSGHWKTDLKLPPPPLGGAPNAGAYVGDAKTKAAAPPNGPPLGIPGEAGGGPANNPAVEAAQQRRLQCIPDFGPWTSTEGAPTQIVQTPTTIMLLFEEFHKVRKIHLNSEHPKDLQPSYAGDSVGHWEGDTLVVDTASIKGPVAMGQPNAAPTLHMVERIRKTDGNTALEVLMSYYDTAGGAVPPNQKVTAKWVGGPKIMEWVCEDFGQRDLGRTTE